MKPVIQLIKPALILGGLLLVLPMVGLADKGGNPNVKSEAVTAACYVDDVSARVCSCKGLSNVVLQCGVVYVKHDDIEGAPGEELFDAVFDCGVDADGNPISGPITMIAIKSGSQKNADSGTPYDIDNAPSGSGLFFRPEMCEESAPVCPISDADCEVADDEPPPEPQ